MAIGTGVSPTYKWSSRFPVIKNATTATVSSGAIAANTTFTTTVTLATTEGCAVGDGVLVFPGTDMLGCQFTAHISAANTIKVQISNTSAGSLTPASSTWTFLVLYASDNVGVGI